LESEQPMKIRSFVQIATSLAVGTFFSFSAAGQSAAEWDAYKAAHGIDASVNYNDWAAQQNSGGAAPSTPSAPAATFSPQQQMILNAGQAAMPALQQWSHDFFWGKPVDPAQQAAQQAQQQRQLAANQLNNSGIYLLKQKNYAGAINEFQKALGQTPNDPNILHNLALAKQKIKDTGVAAQNSGALSQLLGDTPASSGAFDFDGLTHSQISNPNSSALNLVNLNSDGNMVDLRGATKTSVDPASLKSQLNSLFGNSEPTSAPPDPRLQLPEAKDIELLFDPPQPAPSQWPGSQRPASDTKLVNSIDAEEQTKAQAEAVFAQPGGLDDIMQQKIQDDALNGLAKPAQAIASGEPSDSDQPVGSLAESSAAVTAAQARAKIAFDQYVEKHGADGHIVERAAAVQAAQYGEGYSPKELQEQQQKALLDYQKRQVNSPATNSVNGGQQPAANEVILGGKG
jgi:tetratricopeptide (TPR) repeat protein